MIEAPEELLAKIGDMEFRLMLTKSFINAQLLLHKIEFTATSNNKHLEVMNKFNETLNVINILENTYKRNYRELMKTKRELEESLKLSEENNKLRFFIHEGIEYEITGSYHTKEGYLMHQIKNLKTNSYRRKKTLDGSLGEIIPTSEALLKRTINKN
jgi:hypothetical protein